MRLPEVIEKHLDWTDAKKPPIGYSPEEIIILPHGYDGKPAVLKYSRRIEVYEEGIIYTWLKGKLPVPDVYVNIEIDGIYYLIVSLASGQMLSEKALDLSKEDILIAVSDRMTAESNQMLAAIRDRSDLCGKEKLKTIFKESINRPVQNDIFTVVPNFHNNPRLLFSLLHETIEEVAPDYLLPIIKEGISDGSIETDYPEQLAELILLVANVWMNPMIFDDSEEESYRKMMIFRQMLQGFGLDIVDREMSERLQELTSIYQKNK